MLHFNVITATSQLKTLLNIPSIFLFKISECSTMICSIAFLTLVSSNWKIKMLSACAMYTGNRVQMLYLSKPENNSLSRDWKISICSLLKLRLMRFKSERSGEFCDEKSISLPLKEKFQTNSSESLWDINKTSLQTKIHVCSGTY